MEAVCILLNDVGTDNEEQSPPDWQTAMRLFHNPQQFIHQLVSFNKDAVSQRQLKNLKPYVEKPEFQLDRVSFGVTSMEKICEWVHTIYNYALTRQK